jgi:hypothetical protein
VAKNLTLILTTLVFAAGTLALSSVAQATKCKPPMVCPTNKAKSACPLGMVKTVDTRGKCCWPGQASDGKVCVGAPTKCPKGYQVSADESTCERPPCGDGKVHVDKKHCCYPGNK